MFIVGIAGGSGSGKTTFAEKVMKRVNHGSVVHLHQDSYYLPHQPEALYLNGKPNFDHPQSFDWDLLSTHLEELKNDENVECPIYDFVKSIRTKKTVKLGPAKVCLFDGIYTLYDPKIRSILDLKIFLHVDADIRFIRRLHRDVRERGRNLDDIIEQYYDSVRPMHRQFLEPTSQYADIIVGEDTDTAADVVASHVLAQLKQSASRKK